MKLATTETQPIDVQTTLWNPTDDNGKEFNNNGNADAYFYDTIMDGNKIAPKSPLWCSLDD